MKPQISTVRIAIKIANLKAYIKALIGIPSVILRCHPEVQLSFNPPFCHCGREIAQVHLWFSVISFINNEPNTL